MDKLKVAFFGTSDRSIPILEALNKECELVLCITKKDTKVGRHQEIRETEVKKWAREHQIKVVTISSLKGYELEALIEQIKDSNVEYAIVADFSFMIPYPLIEFFDGKLINIHFSLLPLYRGASPVQFAILNGDATTGITYCLVEKKLDAGKIIHQIGYKMSGRETAGELYKTLFELSAENVCYVLQQYDQQQFKQRAQNEDDASYTYSRSHPENTFIYKEDAKINWKDNVDKIYNSIRAFNPWPIAWTTLGELQNNKKAANSKMLLRQGIDPQLTAKIFEAEIVMDNKEQKLNIKTIQVEGRNKMDWKTFENGYATTKEQLKSEKEKAKEKSKETAKKK